MPIYIMLSSLTDEGRKTVKANPQRIKEVNKEVEKLGVKVLSQYATLGPFDFVSIVDAPDNLAVARMSAELGSPGTIKVTTLAAMPIDDFIAKFKQ
jgi:uncharacterized protein with GYD domain